MRFRRLLSKEVQGKRGKFVGSLVCVARVCLEVGVGKAVGGVKKTSGGSGC